MFLYERDLNGFGSSVGTFAGGLGVTKRAFPAARAATAVKKPPSVRVSAAAPARAAQAAVLIQKVMNIKAKADAAKLLTAKLKTAKTPAQAKAAIRGLGALGWEWSDLNPINMYSNVVDAIADVVVGPMQSATGYMVPTQKEIDAAQKSVDQLKENIAERTAAGDPPPESSTTAAKIGEESVKEMQAARDKVLELPSAQEWLGKVKAFLVKAKWVAIIGGAGVAALVAWPYISALRAPGVAMKRSLESR